MADTHSRSLVILNLAGLVVILAGMKAAAPLIVPFLLAVFITVISAPLMIWLQKFKIPAGLSVMIVVGLFVFLTLVVANLVGDSIVQFSQNMPIYSEKLDALQVSLLNKLQGYGFAIDINSVKSVLDPGKAMGMIGSVFSSLSSMLTNTFLILFFVVFILLEASGLPAKAKAAFGEKTTSVKKFQQFSQSVKKYLIIKTLVSLGTGFFAWLSLYLIGVDYPVLWGLVAFLLNFVPNIGSILAAIPPFLLAIVQLGMGSAFAVAVSYLVINMVFGNLIEPKIMGRTLNMSTFVVFMSLVFWGWLLGPIGMLLSIPLTMVFKIAMENSKDYHWVAVLIDR